MICIIKPVLIFAIIVVWYYFIFKTLIRSRERIFGEKKDWITIILATVATIIGIAGIIMNSMNLWTC